MHKKLSDMSKPELRKRVLELIREVDDSDRNAGELFALNEVLLIQTESLEERVEELTHLALELTSAASLLALRNVMPAMTDKIVDAGIYE